MDTTVSLTTPRHVWTHTEIEKLIELIKTKECLWKINSLGFNILSRKNLALKEIGIKINIPFKDVKEETRKLRRKLLNELKLVKTHQINMPTIDYKSKWTYFESLQFMVNDMAANGSKRLSSLTTTTNILILNDRSTDDKVIDSENQFKKTCICQLCLTMVKEDTFFITLSTQINQRETINDVVLKYFNFTQPTTMEYNSENICIVCWQHIKQFYKYATKIRRVQDSFNKHNENVYTTPINIEEGNKIINEKIIKNCANVESNILDQSKSDVDDNDEDTTFEDEKYETNSNSNSNDVEMCKDNQSTLSLPRNFDQQIRTEGLLKRFRQIRPVISNDSKTFTCNFCGKTYEKMVSAFAHLQLKHPLPYVCPEGDKRFRKLTEVIKHIKNDHQIYNTVSKICPICGKMLNSKASVSLHIETIHRPANQPKIQCKKCGTWLASAHILKVHMKRQHLVDKVAVKCDQCTVILSSVDRLEAHKNRCHGDFVKEHKCSICEKTFRLKVRLKEHISSLHGSGQPLYKCDFCPQTFNVRSNSYKHRRRMHPKEHQEIIDKRAAEKVICNNTNQADVNDEIYNAIISLKHECKMCPEKFKYKKYLTKHTLTVHKNLDKNKNSGSGKCSV